VTSPDPAPAVATGTRPVWIPAATDRPPGRARTVMAVLCGFAMLAIWLATVGLAALTWSSTVRPLFGSPAQDLVSASAFLAWSAVGALVVARRPGNRVGLILVFAGLAGQTWILTAHYAALGLLVHPGSLPASEEVAWLSGWVVSFGLAFAFLFLLFPDGRLPSRRWRPFAWFAGAALAFILLTWATEPGPLYGVFDLVDNPAGIEGIDPFLPEAAWGFFVLAIMGSVVAPVVRLRRSSGVQRLQLKWFTYAGAMGALTFVTMTIGSDAGPPITTVAALTYPVAVFALPVAVFIAIFRHHLYDIDAIISRTIVVGALAVMVTAGYVLIVALVGGAIGWAGETGLGLSVLATAVVAAAFQPVRAKVQRLANRLVYGKRATPYEVLTVLARHMGDVYAAEDLLPHLAKTLAQGIGASRAEVWLRAGRQLHRVASWPADVGRSAELPVEDEPLNVPSASEVAVVRHQGVLVGALAVTMPPGQALSAVEQRLLMDLATQVGVALDNLRLVQDLKTSRMRIVAAQDEERRRIERDIHDGVQQRLVSLTLALRMTAGRLRSTVDDEVASAVDDAADEARSTLAELRRLARGIHPAIVTEGGLAAALESLAERSSVPTEVVGAPMERLPMPIEVTVYYVVAEALANVAKHACATAVEIKMAQSNGCVQVVVADNGVGGATPGAGSGLTGLADRVSALDGAFEVDSPPGRGTRLRAEIPCALS
jgi:signal transduction histidine kinase